MGFIQCVQSWQTLIAGVLALIAAWATIKATQKSASMEVEAAKAQTESALLVERRRIAREGYSFAAMLEAAMKSVLDDVELARKVIKDQKADTKDAYEARQSIKKSGFIDLRSALVKQGGRLALPFLRLEKAIDALSSKWYEMPTAGKDVKVGKIDTLGTELNSIELQAKALQDEAAEVMKRCYGIFEETDLQKPPNKIE
jgi:hypothetical protein